MKSFDAIVIGGGASGFLCAISAAKRGKRVAILEHSLKPLRKVEVSGGGRCNFTNLNVSSDNYVSKDANRIKKALLEFSNRDFIKILEKNRIGYEEKHKGQLFCSKGANAISSALLSEAKGVDIYLGTKVIDVNKEGELFVVKTDKDCFFASSVVVATGGLSYSKIGASGFGYEVAKKFGVNVVECEPSLVSVVLKDELLAEIADLQGVSVPAAVMIKGKYFRDDVLFTHFGMSGPLILQASLYWNKGETFEIDMLPDVDIKKVIKEHRESSKGKKICKVLETYLPKRIAQFVTKEIDCFVTEISNKNIDEIEKRIKHFKIKPKGTYGFEGAEVTRGGVDIREINDESFECIDVKGLFFVGEVLDVAGQLGGYNLQWAWSSGYCAGVHL